MQASQSLQWNAPLGLYTKHFPHSVLPVAGSVGGGIAPPAMDRSFFGRIPGSENAAPHSAAVTASKDAAMDTPTGAVNADAKPTSNVTGGAHTNTNVTTKQLELSPVSLCVPPPSPRPVPSKHDDSPPIRADQTRPWELSPGPPEHEAMPAQRPRRRLQQRGLVVRRGGCLLDVAPPPASSGGVRLVVGEVAHGRRVGSRSECECEKFGSESGVVFRSTDRSSSTAGRLDHACMHARRSSF